jgi:hypothetical protein
VKIVQVAAFPVIAAAALVATTCGGGSSSVTIHGTLTPSSGLSSVSGPGVNASSYAGCRSASPVPGTQVTVTRPGGTVIGTATLGLWSPASIVVSGTRVYSCAMPFTIKGVPSQARYGFQVNGVPGTIWKTSVSHVSLDVRMGRSGEFRGPCVPNTVTPPVYLAVCSSFPRILRENTAAGGVESLVEFHGYLAARVQQRHRRAATGLGEALAATGLRQQPRSTVPAVVQTEEVNRVRLASADARKSAWPLR